MLDVAKSKFLARTNKDRLPPNWSTLYSLSRIENHDENTIAAAYADGMINVKMTRKHVNILLEKAKKAHAEHGVAIPRPASRRGARQAGLRPSPAYRAASRAH
jgi:hypothetical protein